MAVHPVHTNRINYLETTLEKTLLWSAFRKIVACYTNDGVMLLNKRSGRPAAFFPSILEKNEVVHKIAFDGERVFLGTDRRIISQGRDGPRDIVPTTFSPSETIHLNSDREFLVIGNEHHIEVWSQKEVQCCCYGDYPDGITSAFLFNRELFAANTDPFCAYRTLGLENGGDQITLEPVQTILLFGNDRFRAICTMVDGVYVDSISYASDNKSKIQTWRFPSDEQFIDMEMDDEFLVAVTRNTILTSTPEELPRRIKGEKRIVGICKDEPYIYICYEDSITRFNPVDLSEEVKLRGECAQIKKICKIGDCFLIKTKTGEFRIWQQNSSELKKRTCCTLL